MPERPMTGRSLVTRRAIVDIVRAAVLGSYGVTGVDAGPLARLLGRLGFREPGIRVRLDRGLEIDLHLTVAYGVPVAEVARQVDSAVRYAIRRGLDRDVRRLTVHVGGLHYQPASVPPTRDVPVPAPAEDPTDALPRERTEVRAAATIRGPTADGDGAASSAEPGGEPAAPAPAITGGRRRRRDPRSNGQDPG